MRTRWQLFKGLLVLLDPTRRWIKGSPVNVMAPRRATCAVVPGLARDSVKAVYTPGWRALSRATPDGRNIVDYNDSPSASGGARRRLDIIAVYLKALVHG